MGPGSAKHMIDLLEKEIGSKSKSTPITIVGAGALGLYSTLELTRRGYSRLTLLAESFSDLTSHKASGLLSGALKINDSPSIPGIPGIPGIKDACETQDRTVATGGYCISQDLAIQISLDGYEFYQTISRGHHPAISAGARFIPVYSANPNGDEFFGLIGRVMRPGKEVILDFGRGKRHSLLEYTDTMFLDPDRLIREIHEYFTQFMHSGAGQIQYQTRKINQWDEIPDEIIVNCTGLGSPPLTQDLQISPKQGHLILLKNQIPQGLNYILMGPSKQGITSDGFEIQRQLYFMPKVVPGGAPADVGVLGVTRILGAYPDNPHENEFDKIIQAAAEFFG